MAKVLVTGGAGFIGSHIGAALAAQGDEVQILDDFSTGHESNVEAVGKARVFRGSVTDLELVRQAVEGCDYVYHQAALASVPRSVEDPITSTRVNVMGSLNVLVAARDAGVKRFIYAASSSAYGDSEVLPKVETMREAPKSPYAVAKLSSEQFVSVFATVYGMQTLCIRYFNVFGPRQDPNSPYAAVIPLFVDALLEGRAPVIHGDGEQSRDFTFVENVVHANLLALRAPRLGGETVNVALGDRVTLNELYRQLAGLVGSDIAPEYGPERVGDVKHSQADITRARQLLGYEAQVPFEEGLKRTVEWYTRNQTSEDSMS
jgi:nucleoside-diphosphate-sugar epimerase